MGRRASESAAGNLIPKTDYPKTGYWVVNELYASGHASRAQGCDGYAVSRPLRACHTQRKLESKRDGSYASAWLMLSTWSSVRACGKASNSASSSA